MRKFIQFEDGSREELAPLTYEEFLYLGLWVYGSDTSWNEWKHKNNFVELDEFNEAALNKENRIIIEAGTPAMLFDPTGQGDWHPFSAWEHDGRSKRTALGLHWVRKAAS
jgi:hypothetical protein